jgi:hypothetical protein
MVQTDGYTMVAARAAIQMTVYDGMVGDGCTDGMTAISYDWYRWKLHQLQQKSKLHSLQFAAITC